MTATEKTVHFSLKGSDFTRLVRDIFLSDDPAKAYRVITSGLRGGEGIQKIAEDVLGGDRRFNGDESAGIGVQAEEEGLKDAYQKQVRFLFAGRLKVKGKWYRPIGKVSSWGREDLRNRHGVPVSAVYNDSNIPKGFSNRSWHYCSKDEIVQVVEDTDYIFETCGEPPHWWQPNLTAATAVADALSAGRTIEERGWSATYGTVQEDEEYEDQTERQEVDDDEELDDRKRERLELEEAWQATEDEAERQRFEARLAEYRKQILEQAHGDMLRLEWDGGHIDVPRAPFVNWAVDRRSNLRKYAPEWKTVCPTGLKMQLDNPYHSDWMVGAGLELSWDYHKHPAQDAAVEAMFKIQRELAGFECTVLVEGPTAYGKAVHGKPGKKCPKGSIVVLPNLSPKYVKTVHGASAVIAEAGGKTAHLAQVGLEAGLPIVVLVGAREEFPEGTELTVDTVNGRITTTAGDDEW